MTSSKQKRRLVSVAQVAPLKPESKLCLRNLAAYDPEPTQLPNPRHHPPSIPFSNYPYPLSRSAAVLVALFVGRFGDLYVLLSRRSETLKSYAGDTSLPGGKYDDEDRSLEDTARREAFEEIGLPRDKRLIPLLCTLEPFLSGNNLIVTPVVVLITDPTIRPILNRPEVASIFSHPLHSFLGTTAPFPPHPANSKLNEGEPAYHTYYDVQWGEGPVRMHRFLTGREEEGIKPVFGLTAAILLRVAVLGYGRTPDFPMYAPGQATMASRISYAFQHQSILKEALEVQTKRKRIPKSDGRGSSSKSKDDRTIRSRL